MKRNFLNLIAVAGIVLGGALTASAEEHLIAKVPFSFVLAGLQFQPGEYNVYESNTGIITVQGAGRAAAVLSMPGNTSKANDITALEFASDGSEHHLVGVQVEGTVSRTIPAPKSHKLSMSTLVRASK